MGSRFFLAILLTGLAACAPVREPARPTPVMAWDAPALAELIAAAEAAPSHGLPAETAALEEIARFRGDAVHDQVAAAQLDAAADALLISLARSLAHGASDPAVADPQWLIPVETEVNAAALLARRTAGESPTTLLDEVAPQSQDYALLREELARVTAEPAGAVDAQQTTRESRLRSLRASLERWRWLPRSLPAPRVEARTPQFEVAYFANGGAPQRHAAIVGARATPTPAFAAVIHTVTLNPYWEPPAGIVQNELLPRFRRNPAAAEREGFEAVDARGGVVASPDWTARPFPYRIRQRPGPGNALGRLRFDLPNPHAIFLHDTPSRGLFARAERALSHGCIRVQDPLSLAEAVLAAPAWSVDALAAEIEAGQTRTIALENRVPVFVLYMTATVGDGAVSYAEDIYQRDERVVSAIDAPDVSLASGRLSQMGQCAP
jgi:murein L,D-transpeptidase YcbB/YkuD